MKIRSLFLALALFASPAFAATINSATPNAASILQLGDEQATAACSVAGLTASGATLTVEGSNNNGMTWAAVNGVAPTTGALFTTLTTDQQFRVNAAGHTTIRERVSATGTGIITVTCQASRATGLVGLSTPLPAGTAVIGTVTLGAGSLVLGKVGIDQTTPGTTNGVFITGGNSSGAVAQASTTSGQSGPLVQGAVTTAAPTYTTAQTNPLSLTTAGGLRMDVASINGVTAQGNSGNLAGGVARTTIATNSVSVPLWGHGSTAAAVPAGATMAGGLVQLANVAALTAGNLAAPVLDQQGRQIVTVGNARANVAQVSVAVASASETTLIAAGAANVFNDITTFCVSTAGTAAGTITVKDATAGTTRAIFNYPDAALAPAGAPFCLPLMRPWTQTSTAANWTVTNSSTQSYNFFVQYELNK